MLEAIVLDFDGVIADTEPLHFQSFRDVLAQEQVALTEAEYYRDYLGLSDAAALRAIAGRGAIGWTERDLASLMRRKAARFEELTSRESVLAPGADAFIRKAAAVVPIAVASGARRVEILRVLDAADLTGVFSAVVAAEDVAAGKPAPDPYVRALDLLATAHRRPTAGRSIAIEDSARGLASARAA